MKVHSPCNASAARNMAYLISHLGKLVFILFCQVDSFCSHYHTDSNIESLVTRSPAPVPLVWRKFCSLLREGISLNGFSAADVTINSVNRNGSFAQKRKQQMD